MRSVLWAFAGAVAQHCVLQADCSNKALQQRTWQCWPAHQPSGSAGGVAVSLHVCLQGDEGGIFRV